MQGELSWKERMHMQELAEKKKSKERAIRKATERKERENNEM